MTALAFIEQTRWMMLVLVAFIMCMFERVALATGLVVLWLLAVIVLALVNG